MITGKCDVSEREAHQRCPLQTFVQHSCLLSIKSIVNYSQIKHSALSLPLQKSSQGSVKVSSDLVPRVYNLPPPHTAHKTQGKDDERAEYDSENEAAITAETCLTACDCDVCLAYGLSWHHRHGH